MIRFLYTGCLILVLAALAGRPLGAAPLAGCWLAPETVFTEDRTYSLAERRALAGQSLDRMREHGIDTVFLECFARGHANCRMAVAPLGTLPAPVRFVPAVRGEPDLLDLYIDEAGTRAMHVHAWVHMCYFRSDNIAHSRDDDETHSLFHDLLVDELKAARDNASEVEVRKLVDAALDSLERGFDTRNLSQALLAHGYGLTHTPVERIVERLQASGLPGPAIFAYASDGSLHPPLEKSANGSIYLDCSNAEVARRLVDAVGSLAEEHPGLAGIQLDHIRYPEGDYGYRQVASGGAVRLAPPENGARERAVSALVGACKERVRSSVALSAAVLPGYYLGWSGPGGPQRGVGQGWRDWGLSFYTPMLYGLTGQRLARALESCRRGVKGDPPVYAGIASLAQARGSGWVLFDYTALR